MLKWMQHLLQSVVINPRNCVQLFKFSVCPIRISCFSEENYSVELCFLSPGHFSLVNCIINFCDKKRRKNINTEGYMLICLKLHS